MHDLVRHKTLFLGDALKSIIIVQRYLIGMNDKGWQSIHLGLEVCPHQPKSTNHWRYSRVHDQVCNTPILNSLVAGLWLAASIPKLTHVLVSNGSITASSHSLLAA
jgi:hypothetical protein